MDSQCQMPDQYGGTIFNRKTLPFASVLSQTAFLRQETERKFPPIRPLRSHQMKTTLPILALVVSTAAYWLLRADDETSQARNGKFKQLEQQINDYYNVDSPWSLGCRGKGRTSTCDYIELETTLVHLMGAEVRCWQLCDNLRQRNDQENHAT